MKSNKRQKQIVKTIILGVVVALSIMMITMIVVIKIFGGAGDSSKSEVTDDDEVEVKTRRSEGIIHDIDYEDKDIKLWVYNDDGYITAKIDLNAELKDAYGEDIVIRELKLGDMLVFEYEILDKNIIALQKDSNSWEKSDITNTDIDTENQTIRIGNNSFEYTDNIFVIGEDSESFGIDEISNMDSLFIQGTGNTIWSIAVLESPGYIKVINSPSEKGKVAIDNNKFYDLKEAIEKIPVQIGARKVVIYMDDYNDFVKHLDITKDNISEIDLQNLSKPRANLDVNVTNTDVNYTVHINNEKYQKRELIKITPGKYKIRLTANGYKTLKDEIQLLEGNQVLDLRLEKEKTEDKNKDTGKEPESPENNNNNNQESNDENKTVQIIIETEPEKARVFVSGVYKGETPSLTGLKPGEYNISIEKEGYSTLYTTIVVDSGKSQKSFLYELDKK